MSLANHLERLKQLLSEDDLAAFERLSEKLKTIGGDFSLLSESERALIAKMEQKYGDAIQEEAIADADTVLNATPAEPQARTGGAVAPESLPLLKTEFAEYVKDMLLRELPQMKDLKQAVNYAFEQKWIPQELQNPDVCETLFERFFSDIELANQWRYELMGEKVDSNNKTMAIGLTWFMYIYQLKKWVEKYN
ncbi:MAG: hypothetical protein HWE27_12545 [Gammaproteobacteria bacterium]|nr:hypothetical protein [Gammaproteobacteria bacterium]